MIVRARTIVTMDGPPIEHGAVAIRGNTIRDAGRTEDIPPEAGDEIVDLGDQVLMPGLINAHCHLDYTMMRRAIAPPSSFTRWIQRINALKRTLADRDYLEAIALGFKELKTWGTTTVLNLEAFPELLPQMPPPPIRTWWFYELIDLRQRHPTDELLAGALTFFNERQDWLGGFGLNPHAPYTASPELFRLANECAQAGGMLLTTHIAESGEESEMFRCGSGALFDFLASLGRDMSDCGNGSTLARLARDGVLDSRWIVAHLNELDEDDIACLAELRPHIVHCPRSHRYFGHRPFEFHRLHDLGLNISLGTDSLASNQSLNLFSEMRSVRESQPWLGAEDLLKTVTINPARALDMENRLGCIAAGACADLIALPIAADGASVYEGIVSHSEPVDWMMIDGKILT